MGKVLVTGFKPFSLLTAAAGNPSEIVANALGDRFGAGAEVRILDVDATCLKTIEAMGKATDIRGVLMLGASMQLTPAVLEMDGVAKADGLLGRAKRTIRSTAAERLRDFARSIGVPVASAPITPLVYWCLRSYAAALEWAEPKNVPCVFLHLNTLRVSSKAQTNIAGRFFENLAAW